jgi:hypothetical protein
LTPQWRFGPTPAAQFWSGPGSTKKAIVDCWWRATKNLPHIVVDGQTLFWRRKSYVNSERLKDLGRAPLAAVSRQDDTRGA